MSKSLTHWKKGFQRIEVEPKSYGRLLHKETNNYYVLYPSGSVAFVGENPLRVPIEIGKNGKLSDCLEEKAIKRITEMMKHMGLGSCIIESVRGEGEDSRAACVFHANDEQRIAKLFNAYQVAMWAVSKYGSGEDLGSQFIGDLGELIGEYFPGPSADEVFAQVVKQIGGKSYTVNKGA